MIEVSACDHLHVKMSPQSLECSLFGIRSHSMSNKLGYSLIVRHHEAFKPKFLLKKFLEQPLIRRCRDRIEIVE